MSDLNLSALRELAEEAREGGYEHVSMISPEVVLRLIEVAAPRAATEPTVILEGTERADGYNRDQQLGRRMAAWLDDLALAGSLSPDERRDIHIAIGRAANEPFSSGAVPVQSGAESAPSFANAAPSAAPRAATEPSLTRERLAAVVVDAMMQRGVWDRHLRGGQVIDARVHAEALAAALSDAILAALATPPSAPEPGS